MVDHMCAHGEPGKVETRFRWLIDQLEARLPVAGAEFSSRPPELVLLEALDALLKDMDRLKFDLLLPTQTQLAASQLREQRLRGAVSQNHAWHKNYDEYEGYPESELAEVNEQALALQQDLTALQSYVAGAGEVMRRMALNVTPLPHWDDIRALPAVTLGDLHAGEQDG